MFENGKLKLCLQYQIYLLPFSLCSKIHFCPVTSFVLGLRSECLKSFRFFTEFTYCESNALTASTVLNSNYCNFIKSFPYLIQLPFIYASFHFNQYYRFIFFSTFGYNKYFLIFTAVSLVTFSQIHFSFAP